ncbi:hypothetical protein EUTSA_v10026928mg [Eutrema salsugineum]|uniref:PHD-type domain-containing protein n=1 Tax=Eutrema salsugineum TaxID=72664 RepID=V4MGH6_EUTSA|nr:hypothetical protein EUTSA_v10026928mg [Eutrema salsugineum]
MAFAFKYRLSSSSLLHTFEFNRSFSGSQQQYFSLKKKTPTMASSTHEDAQIVVPKEIPPVSPPKNTSDSNKYDIAESSSSTKTPLSKTEEQMKSAMQPEIHLEEEEYVNICDTCGDQGFEKSLITCSICKIGAEHIYCMLPVKIKKRPLEWSCYDCTEDGNGMRKGEETSSKKKKGNMEEPTSSKDQLNLLNTQSLSKPVRVALNIDLNAYPDDIDLNAEPSSGERKTESCIDTLKMSDIAPSQRQTGLLNTQGHSKGVGLGLNKDPNLDLDLNKDPNADPNIDVNVDPNPNVDPNIDMNTDLTLSLP